MIDKVWGFRFLKISKIRDSNACSTCFFQSIESETNGAAKKSG